MKRWLVAHLWACGDECDCYYPELQLRAESENPQRSDLVRRWQGMWANEAGSDQVLAAIAELRAMAARYGIDLPEDELFGERVLADEEPIVFPPDTGP